MQTRYLRSTVAGALVLGAMSGYAVLAGGIWEPKAPMPAPRSGLAGGVVDEVLYAIGGYNGPGVGTTVEAYTPATDSWTSKAPMATARYAHAVAVVNGVLYALGGYNPAVPNGLGGILRTMDAYDPSTNTSSIRAPMSTGRYFPSAAGVGGRVYAIGGLSESGVFVSTLEVYDPGSNSWSVEAPMPTARYGAGAGVIGGKIYVVGGSNCGGCNVLSTVEVYDPATNTWATKAPMPTARSLVTAVVAGGMLYAIGGQSNAAFLNTVEAYDPASDTWTTMTPIPTSRYWFAAGVVDGRIYAAGGNGPGGAILASTEAFTPPAVDADGDGVADENDAFPADPTEWADGDFDGIGDNADPEVQVGTWAQKAPLVTGRTWARAETIGGTIYVVGGVNGGCPGAPALASEAYDPFTNTWTPKAVLPAPPGHGGQRGAFATAAVDGKIYAFGGGNCLVFFDDVQVYDPAGDAWSPLTPMPAPRAYTVAVPLDGFIYLIGGAHEGFNRAPNLRYDPATQTWTPIADSLRPRLVAGAGVIDGRIYVAGGSGDETVEVYDPSTNAWSFAAPMSAPIGDAAVAVVNGRLHVFGGADNAGQIVASGAVYHPGLDTWFDAPPLPAVRVGAGAAVAGGILYVPGGASPTMSGNATLFAFTPPDHVPDTDNDGIADPFDPDDDGDGIEDVVDVQPLAVSSAFDDGPGGGQTSGTQTGNPTIRDIEPGGVHAIAGGSSAALHTCPSGGEELISLPAGQSAAVACSGSSTQLAAASSNSTALTMQSSEVIAHVPPGQWVAMGSPVTAGADNTDDIDVNVVNPAGAVVGSFTLGPGESVAVQLGQGSSGEDVLLIEVVVGDILVSAFGRTFPVGDGDGQVTLEPVPTVQDLIEQVNALQLPGGVKRALTVTLRAAEAAAARGHLRAARVILQAFTLEVRALRRKGRLDAATADALVADAQAIAGGL